MQILLIASDVLKFHGFVANKLRDDWRIIPTTLIFQDGTWMVGLEKPEEED